MVPKTTKGPNPKAAVEIPPPNGSVVLPIEAREAIRLLIATERVSGAVALLRASKTTLMAAAAGSGIRRASGEMILRALSELAEKGR